MSSAPEVPASVAGIPFRRLRWPIGIAVVLVAYALLGSALAPWLIQRELPDLVREQLGRGASVAHVEINPFTLVLRAQGFELHDADGTRLAGLDELLVNFEASSLLRRAFTFSELRLAGPYLNVVRDREGTINLLKLLPPEPQPATVPADKPLPRIIINKFRLESGLIELADRVPATEFRTRIGPFGVAFDELSTLPEASGRHDIAITLESGTQIAIGGDVVVNPLRVTGQVTIKGPFLGTLQRYVRDQMKFEVTRGTTDISTKFTLAGRQNGGVDVALDDLAVSLSDVRLSAPDAPEFLGWTRFQVTGGALRWPSNEASARTVQLDGLQVKARMAPDGEIDLVDILTPRGAAETNAAHEMPPASGNEAPAAAGSDASPWKVRVGELGLSDMSVAFVDAAPSMPAEFSVTDLDVKLRDVSNAPGARMPLTAGVVLGGGGTASLDGAVVGLPEFALDAEVKADGIRLAQAQPYVSDMLRLQIRDGALGLEGRLTSGPDEDLGFEGDVQVRDLDTFDTKKKERLLAWRELAVDDLQFSLSGNKARVTRVRLDRPFGRIFIARDQSTNVGDLFIEEAPVSAVSAPAAAEEASAPPPFRARIGAVKVKQGQVDFTDLSLPLPFAARIKDMAGELTTIDTRSAAPSRIRLEGSVDPYGLARVEGQVRVSSPTDLADVNVLFRNIEMQPLSPYTVKFAGRKIARGKINLDLHYQLNDRRMVGANKIVIDELELGEKVPNPDAVDLPLGLAVALLKDANGRIDLDMPVSGSLDDPQFGIGSVLWKAFVNLVTKIATSPFRLLGGLVGMESEDLGRIEFSPGRADLLPPEKEKLLRVAEALVKRPELGVEVPAVVDPQADAAVMRMQKVEALVAQELDAKGRPDSGRALEKRTRQVIEELHERQLPGHDLDTLQERFQAPPADDPQGRPRLDELAYLDQLRADLAAAQVVSDEELAALGASRAGAIATELTATGKVAAARVRVGTRKDVEARDGEWVSAELGVGGVGD